MAFSGPRNPGTFAVDTSLGINTWSNGSNSQTSNDSRATSVTTGFSQLTNYLKVTNFGFTIPQGSTINGIVVEIERNDGQGFGFTIDHSVKIVKAETLVGNDLASPDQWPELDAYKTYGSSTELWGTTWNYTEINASGFGVAIAVATSNHPTTVAIDHIRITVYYTAPNSTMLQFAAADGEPPTTNYATLNLHNNTMCYVFDADTDQSVCFKGIIPRDYAGGDIEIKLYSNHATSFNVDYVWSVAIERIGTTQDIDSDGFSSAKSITVDSTVSNIIKVSTITFTNAEADGILAGELFRIKVTRDADNVADTAGEVKLFKVEVKVA